MQNQLSTPSMPDAILVGFLTDMGMFSHHPKSLTQLLKLPTFQLRDSSNVDLLLRRPRQGSSSLTHVIRRSKKLVVLGENSPMARGYGRLAYKIGAEDGAGSHRRGKGESALQSF